MFKVTHEIHPNAVCRVFDVLLTQSAEQPDTFTVDVMYQLFSDDMLSYNFLSSRKLLTKQFQQSELNFTEYEKQLELDLF